MRHEIAVQVGPSSFKIYRYAVRRSLFSFLFERCGSETQDEGDSNSKLSVSLAST